MKRLIITLAAALALGCDTNATEPANPIPGAYDLATFNGGPLPASVDPSTGNCGPMIVSGSIAPVGWAGVQLAETTTSPCGAGNPTTTIIQEGAVSSNGQTLQITFLGTANTSVVYTATVTGAALTLVKSQNLGTRQLVSTYGFVRR